MGKVIEKVKLTNLFEPAKWTEVEAVVDTGATMLVLPQPVVDKLGWWLGYVEELPGANTQGRTL